MFNNYFILFVFLKGLFSSAPAFWVSGYKDPTQAGSSGLSYAFIYLKAALLAQSSMMQTDTKQE